MTGENLDRILHLAEKLPATHQELALAITRLVKWARFRIGEGNVGRPRMVDREKVAKLREQGLNSVQIAEAMGCASSTIRMMKP